MSSQSPEEIRADIESTRRELGQDVDALADKVTPSKIMDRQKNKVRGAFTSVREHVMGAADDAGSSIAHAGEATASGIEHAGQSVAHAGQSVARKAKGNPLAAGLVAFGAGLLVASLIPASDKERELAAKVEEKAQPLVDQAKDVAREVGENLKEPALEAVDSVKTAAQDAAQSVADEAKASGQAVADQTRDSVDTTKDELSSGPSGSSGSGTSTGSGF
jgi:hypothetical protein